MNDLPLHPDRYVSDIVLLVVLLLSVAGGTACVISALEWIRERVRVRRKLLDDR
jgi:hypothetical protein